MMKQKRFTFKPTLEFLEDRCTPSAGMLDPTFNPTGNPPGTATFGSLSFVQSADVLVQPSGKVVMTGSVSGPQFSAVCFNADGSIDTTFGSGGAAVTTTQKKGQADTCFAATLYPTGGPGDQKILEVGHAAGRAGSIALVRFNANGSLDTSFGSGGYVFTSLDAFGPETPGASDVVLQANGTALPKIVVVTINANNPIELIRYNPDGSIDTSFGSSRTGVVVYQPPNRTGSYPYHLAHGGAAGADLIVAGDGVLVAFTPNGALDTNFGGTGDVSIIQSGRLIYAAYQADGKIVLAKGFSGSALVRYNANGTLDTFFGSGGVVSTGFGNTFAALALQADGKIVLDGGSSLARYNPDGSLDSTFGTGGIAAGPFPGNTVAYQSVAIAPNGDIVTGAGGGSVARFLPSAPQIGSLMAGQSGAGAPVMLTASNITDANPNSTIKQVTFYYYDALGNQVVLGTVTSPDGSGNWDLTVSLPAGSYTLYAQAEDSYMVLGDPFALNLSVQ
jgi:uncharacterized delta-60 repeat protein